MEDDHKILIDKGVEFYAVYDGHSGNQVFHIHFFLLERRRGRGQLRESSTVKNKIKSFILYVHSTLQKEEK